ncbi:MAG: hypothetical protein H0V66_13375 [Bdellovibrionales bacterium]|nr:hypothetical protein [Bdellovibrionales bacterium]
MNILRASAVIVFLALTLQAFAGSVDSHERGLIAVVNLYSNSEKNFKRVLYQNESRRAASFLKKKAKTSYTRVVILEDAEATLENFLEQVETMAAREEIKIIDVIIDLHGLKATPTEGPALAFVNDKHETTATDWLADQLRRVGGSKLRMLYSDACHGSQHNQDWLNAGFKVVAGSKDVDANKSIDIKRFFKLWIKGEAFKTSIDFANSSIMSPLMDKIIKGNSTKVIGGDESLTISDEE